jgi:hypothetical protein
MIMTSRLRLRKTSRGLAPKEIKVEAFLRAASDADLGNAGKTPSDSLGNLI